MTNKAPDATSGDFDAMKPYWDMIDTIMGGADAMRAAAETYLPRLPNETQPNYDRRRATAKFTNLYADVVSTLSAKPFGEEISLTEGSASAPMVALAEDIDGRGNHLHVFAQSCFADGINYALNWIFVDYTRAQAREDGRPLSRRDEKVQGLRPYWVHVPATRMLAVYSDVVNGEEIIVHARMREDQTARDGYSEISVERVRELNRDPIFAVLDDGTVTDRVIGYGPPTFTVWEKRSTNGKSSWEVADSGFITIDVIPLVPFVVGRRVGGGWQVEPPMRPAAELQIEHYQQESGLKWIKLLTAFPMLAGNGIEPSKDAKGQVVPVPVGPHAALYAPPGANGGPHGEWKFIEPAANSLKFLADEVKVTESQLRELGRQPLVASAGITVVGAAFATQKANSAIKAWALSLKDALEQAWALTALWLSDASEPTIDWNLDDLGIDIASDGLADLMSMRKVGDLSQETLWTEAKRRGRLSANFEAKEERKLLQAEMPDADSQDDVIDALPREGQRDAA